MRELLQMAVDALDAITDKIDGTGFSSSNEFSHCLDTIDALRSALAALMPEPWKPEWPAFLEYWTHEGHLQTFEDRERFRSAAKAMIAAAPAPAVPATFVVPGFAQWRDGSAAPVVWEPLTDEQIHDCFQQRHMNKATQRRMITRAIEAHHGIGGGGK